MLEELMKKVTNNYQSVPLFFATFNLEKYLNEGEKGSCMLQVHPELRNDSFIKEQLNGLIDHIRQNYDMEKLSK